MKYKLGLYLRRIYIYIHYKSIIKDTFIDDILNNIFFSICNYLVRKELDKDIEKYNKISRR